MYTIIKKSTIYAVADPENFQRGALKIITAGVTAITADIAAVTADIVIFMADITIFMADITIFMADNVILWPKTDCQVK